MKFRCPNCKQKLDGDHSFSGEDINCPKCHCHFIIPPLDDDDTVAVTPVGTPVPAGQDEYDKKYLFHGQIAKGGMGKIISVTDQRLDREIVVKQLLDLDQDPALVNQLIREAQITARLSHPGIVPIHELGLDAKERIYYTMKHIRGEPLENVLEKLRSGDPEMIEKSPFQRLLLIFSRVCDTIGYANEMGIVHRDIKPDNIMLAPYGEYLVIDWGIAKDLKGKVEDDEKWISSAYRYEPEKGEYGATLQGAVFGSPSYMSPEQARGDVDLIDSRTDVFALGALLFELLTLSPPYVGETPEAVVQLAAKREIQKISTIRKLRSDPKNPWPHLRGGELPESLLAVAMKAMRMDPDERYQSPTELRREIDKYLSGHTTAAENAGFFRTLKLAVSRHREVAGALAGGLLLAGAAVGFTANLNQNETEKAKRAQQEAELYVTQANRERVKTHNTRLEVAPSYVEMARMLANRGEMEDALVVAGLAAQYDPFLMDAVALGKVLEIHAFVNGDRDKFEPVEVVGFPSLERLLQQPETLATDNGGQLPEQTCTCLSKAYAEVGLSRLASELTAQQPNRLDAARKKLKSAWQGKRVDWKLSLAPEFSKLCLSNELRGSFSDDSAWATEINRDYPGRTLHLDIRGFSKVPNLEVLSGIAVESVRIAPQAKFSTKDLAALTKVPSLKIINIQSGDFSNLAFLKDLPLVALQIINKSKIIDLSALQDCTTLRTLSVGKNTLLTRLSSIPEGSLEVFTGQVKGGDFSHLAKMPIQLLGIHNGNNTVDLKPLNSKPIEAFIAEQVDITSNWKTLASWPLRYLTIDSSADIDSSELSNIPLRQLTDLNLVKGHWLGDTGALFPALRNLFDETGSSFLNFTEVPSLENIQLIGDRRSVCYFSALQQIPETKHLQVSPEMRVQVLPEEVALALIKQDWEQAAEAGEGILELIEARPELIVAQTAALQLEQVIAEQNDAEEAFVSSVRTIGGSAFQMVLCGLDRKGAIRFASNVGGKLAGIQNSDQQKALRTIMKEHPEYPAFWIGGNRVKTSSKRVLTKFPREAPSESDSCIYPFIIEWPKAR